MREKMWAMPTAREGAPPVRLKRVFSPILNARSAMCWAVTGKPQEEMIAAACSGALPTTPAGLLIAKKTPGSSAAAATMAVTATSDSSSMLP